MNGFTKFVYTICGIAIAIGIIILFREPLGFKFLGPFSEFAPWLIGIGLVVGCGIGIFEAKQS